MTTTQRSQSTKAQRHKGSTWWVQIKSFFFFHFHDSVSPRRDQIAIRDILDQKKKNQK
jgi:hypothetical protein